MIANRPSSNQRGSDGTQKTEMVGSSNSTFSVWAIVTRYLNEDGESQSEPGIQIRRRIVYSNQRSTPLLPKGSRLMFIGQIRATCRFCHPITTVTCQPGEYAQPNAECQEVSAVDLPDFIAGLFDSGQSPAVGLFLALLKYCVAKVAMHERLIRSRGR